MAHKKAGSSKARQGSNVAGKRLGIKVSGGSYVKPGQIIVRQRGRKFDPGQNVKMGKDFTIYSLVNGVVSFRWKTRKKKEINVVKELAPAKKSKEISGGTRTEISAKRKTKTKSAKTN